MEKLISFLQSLADLRGFLPTATIEKLCPACGEKLRAAGITGVRPKAFAEKWLKTNLQVSAPERLQAAVIDQVNCGQTTPRITFVGRCMADIGNAIFYSTEGAAEFCSLLYDFCAMNAWPKPEPMDSGLAFTAAMLGSDEGDTFDVVLVSSGPSLIVAAPDGQTSLPVYFPPELLSDPDTISLFEGKPAKLWDYENMTALQTLKKGGFGHLDDSIRSSVPAGFPLNTVGVFTDCRYGEYTAPNGEKGKGILAKLKLFDERFRNILKAAWEKGFKDLVSLSLDAVGNFVNYVSGEQNYWSVSKFDHVNEVTIVDAPAAGGWLLSIAGARIVAQHIKAESSNMEKLYLLFQKFYAPLVAGLSATASAEERDQFMTTLLASNEGKAALSELSGYLMSLSPQNPPPAAPPSGGTAPSNTAPGNAAPGNAAPVDLAMLQAGVTQAVQNNLLAYFAQREAAEKERLAMLSKSRDRLRVSLQAANVAAPLVEATVGEYGDVVLSEAEIARIVSFRQKLSTSTASLVGVPGHTSVVLGAEQYDKHVKALTGMLIRKDVDGVPRFHSLHQSYAHVGLNLQGGYMSPERMGNLIMNDLARCLTPNPMIVSQDKYREQLQAHRASMQGAALSTTTWAEGMGDSIRRAVIMLYQQGEFNSWRDLCGPNITSAPDFRTMRRVRIGGLADLETVNELSSYNEIAIPGDEEETFVVTKKGNLFSYSMEAAINDDLNLLSQIIAGIALSANRTLYKAVWNILTTNAAMGDGIALFHASHNNLGSTALSTAGLAAGILAMRTQTQMSSGEIMGNSKPTMIAGPANLEQTAWELSRSNVSQSASRTETVMNWFLGFGLRPLPPVLHFTDANDWYLFGDPATSPIIEVSFLGGRQEPEVLIQDQPNAFSMFNSDAIQLKGRHIYGVKALDWRFVYKASVA